MRSCLLILASTSVVVLEFESPRLFSAERITRCCFVSVGDPGDLRPKDL